MKCSKREFLQFSRATVKTFSFVGQALGFISQRFWDFVEIFLFPKILSFQLFGNLLSTDKNLVPLNLWLGKTITREKVRKYLSKIVDGPGNKVTNFERRFVIFGFTIS